MAEARKRKCYDFKFKNCGLYLRAACINYFSSYLRLVFEGGLYLKAASIGENTVFGNVITLKKILRNEIPGNNGLSKVTST